WANGLAVRRTRPSDPEGSRGGNRIRFSPAETDRLGKARPRIYRPWAGCGWPRSCGAPRFGPRNKSLPLGRPELPLLDALQRRPASQRSPSQPCRRAHDLPAERISNRGRSDPPGARRLIHGHMGYRSRKRSVITPKAPLFRYRLAAAFHRRTALLTTIKARSAWHWASWCP